MSLIRFRDGNQKLVTNHFSILLDTIKFFLSVSLVRQQKKIHSKDLKNH